MNNCYDTLLAKGAARSPARPGNRCTGRHRRIRLLLGHRGATRNSKPNSRHHCCIPGHQGAQIPQRTFRSKRDCAYDGELATMTTCTRDCSSGNRKSIPYFEEKNNSLLVRQIHIAFKRDGVFRPALYMLPDFIKTARLSQRGLFSSPYRSICRRCCVVKYLYYIINY